MLGFICLNKRQVDPVFLDYLTNIPNYIEKNIDRLTNEDIEDALLSLCITDLLIRYGLIKNNFNEILRPKLIEALNNQFIANRTKCAKNGKFEKILNENRIEFETNRFTNVYHVDYILDLKEQVN
jgi:hypothetical protein